MGELYRAHRRRAFGLAYRVLHDGAAAEDAVHAAFLALWEQAPRLDPYGGRLESLLMTIVHRRAVDLARARARDAARRSAPHGPEEADAPDAAEGIPDQEAMAPFEAVIDDGTELQRRLFAALNALPSEQREAIECAYFGGMTYRAIAVRLGLPEGTVKSRLRLAMQRLRSVLGDEDRG